MPELDMDGFTTGLLAGAVSAGLRTIDLAGTGFDEAIARALKFLDDSNFFELHFRTSRHPVHGNDPPDGRQVLRKALSYGLAILDPDAVQLRIVFDSHAASRMLDALPTGRAVYIEMARVAFGLPPAPVSRIDPPPHPMR